jgi:hypothetical protein
MKTKNQQATNPNKPQTKNINRPENKNSLDSREGEEQLTKGDDVTHNKKEKHTQNRKTK